MKSNQVTNFLLYICVGVLLLGIGYKLGQAGPNASYSTLLQSFQSSNANKNFDFDLFFDVFNKLETKYVDKTKLNTQKMFYGAIKGMVATINDPYTYFLTPDENKQTKEQLAGKLEGIGAMLEMKNGHITVISLIKNSPAENAGMKPGDVIVKVNNSSTQNMPLDKVVSQVRGPKGTTVDLDVQRDGNTKHFKITRDEIQTNSIDLSYETSANCQSNCPKVALLQLHQFGDTTNDEWDKAVDEISQKYANKEISGLVVDVRNNPGGYLQSAVYITSDFLDKDQLIVSQVSTDNTTKYTALPTGRLKDIPVSVLINQYSASAAEIFSGALKDYGRATLVGEKSFGKGSVQEAMDLKDGSGLHITVAKWILPKGSWINGKGIEPNIKIDNNFKDTDEYSKDKDAQLQKAIDVVSK